MIHDTQPDNIAPMMTDAAGERHAASGRAIVVVAVVVESSRLRLDPPRSYDPENYEMACMLVNTATQLGIYVACMTQFVCCGCLPRGTLKFCNAFNMSKVFSVSNMSKLSTIMQSHSHTAPGLMLTK